MADMTEEQRAKIEQEKARDKARIEKEIKGFEEQYQTSARMREQGDWIKEPSSADSTDASMSKVRTAEGASAESCGAQLADADHSEGSVSWDLNVVDGSHMVLTVDMSRQKFDVSDLDLEVTSKMVLMLAQEPSQELLLTVQLPHPTDDDLVRISCKCSYRDLEVVHCLHIYHRRKCITFGVM